MMRDRLDMQFRRNLLHQAGQFCKAAIQRTLPARRTFVLMGTFELGLIGDDHFPHRRAGCEMNVKATHDVLLSI